MNNEIVLETSENRDLDIRPEQGETVNFEKKHNVVTTFYIDKEILDFFVDIIAKNYSDFIQKRTYSKTISRNKKLEVLFKIALQKFVQDGIEVPDYVKKYFNF